MSDFSDVPQWWFDAGKADRAAGNEIPAVTREDFFRELDPTDALACWRAYQRGFNPVLTSAN